MKEIIFIQIKEILDQYGLWSKEKDNLNNVKYYRADLEKLYRKRVFNELEHQKQQDLKNKIYYVHVIAKEDLDAKLMEFHNKLRNPKLDYFDKIHLIQKRIDLETMLFLIKDQENLFNQVN